MTTTPRTGKGTDAPETPDVQTSDDMEALSAEISQIRADVTSLVDTVRRIGQSRAQGLAGTAADKANEGLAAGEAVLSGISSDLSDIERDIAASTRENPWRALSIAAVGGFLFGVLYRR